MDSKAVIGLSVILNLLAFGRVVQLYIWPHLRGARQDDALTVLIVPHMFRFVGLSFLVPGVVSPAMSPAFAYPAAFGDLAAAILALIATLALSARASWAIAFVWLFNLEGTADLLFAYYQGVIGVGLGTGALGAAFYIPTLVVPPLLVTHALIFRVLLRTTPQALA
jgi:hypothetical protein